MQSTSFFVPFALLPTHATHFQEPTGTPNAPSAPTPGQAPGTTQQPGQPNSQAPADPCGGSTMPIYLGIFMLLMYFMIMRPEQKRRKEQQNLLSSIKTGDVVVTIGGMHGEVHSLTETTVVLKVDTSLMTFDRTAIARVVRNDAAAPPAKKA